MLKLPLAAQPALIFHPKMSVHSTAFHGNIHLICSHLSWTQMALMGDACMSTSELSMCKLDKTIKREQRL